MENQSLSKPFYNNLTFQILIAMLLGGILGVCVHQNLPEASAKEFSTYIKLLATIFIRLVQMIIAPLVFSTLTLITEGHSGASRFVTCT